MLRLDFFYPRHNDAQPILSEFIFFSCLPFYTMSTLAAYLPRRNVTGSSLGLFTLFIGILTGVALTELFSYLRKRHRQTTKTRSLYNIQPEIARGVVELIGNTPLVRINSLSDATGCEILASITYTLFHTLN
jgi:uncharacterized membrane protein